RLQKIVDEEGEKVSEELDQIAQKVANEVAKNKIDISSFNPNFQELIRIQSGKANGIKYYPMFLRWAISVYSQAGHSAYETMKKWQNKTAYHILKKMAIENINNDGRIGFFSHDSFKIQK
ncbi:11646_t:CDS:2, partial [Funneliformis geosporum]